MIDRSQLSCAFVSDHALLGRAGAGPEVGPLAPTCMERLAAMLSDLAKNPRNPSFSHYLFETQARTARCMFDSQRSFKPRSTFFLNSFILSGEGSVRH